MFSSPLLLVAALAALRSFSLASEAPPAEITPAPTPTIAKRQVAGGTGTPILSTLHYAYTNLPYQVYPYQVLRGPQYGFNQCNSTTLGDSSNCQTLIFNGPDDFCLWGSPDPNGLIGNVEAKVVAYCTKPYHGTRVIPPGSITGLQWTKTSAYIQVVGFISNGGLGLDPTDQGGELDPHGADLQGNPLGGVVFSNGTADSDGTTLTQVYNWNTFVGGNQFCFKACYNSITSPDYCQNVYDLVGCDYNMPSAVQNGTFTECDGDLQDVVGIYTVNGTTTTWSMPATLTATPPYTPRVPASSNCKTYSSTDILLAGSSTTSVAASATGKSGSSSGASGSNAGSGSHPSSTFSSSSSSSSASSGVKFPFVSLALLLGGMIAGGMMVL